MTESFDKLYRAFEDRFRGSRDIIRQRLRVYLPLLERLPADAARARRAIDLGCGRGEWLEIAAQAGFEPRGVDLNIGMAQTARDAGFTVAIDDAVSFLRQQDSASASLITAFHLAEHLPFDGLLELLGECYRVLEDGGLLIVETPNPENISVGTWAFHVDPTHQKPLPPLLLEFLAQQSGFSSTAILRLNGVGADPTAGALQQATETLFVSANDYACLARKQSGEEKDDDILHPFVAATTQPNPANIQALSEAARRTDIGLQDASMGLQELSATVAQAGAQIAALNEQIVRQDHRIEELSRTVDGVQAQLARGGLVSRALRRLVNALRRAATGVWPGST